MEKVLLIVAIVLLAISVGVSVANLVVSKKKSKGGENGGDVIKEIETLNDNLNELKNIINEHTTKERENLSANLTNVINASNSGLVPMLSEYMKSFKETLNENLSTSKEILEEIRKEMKSATAEMGKGTDESLGALKKEMQEALEKMNNTISNSLKEVRDDNRNQLEKVRENNSAQLEKMRETVDEKLTSTLNSRITSAFEVVQKSIDSVQQGFGEMKELTGKVGNLNKMFSNVKTRGGWGEVALESLLDQILSPEQYKKQYRIERNSQEMVDFVIVMPGQSDKELFLPIDCKFPLDRYVELVEASESGDTARIESARKELVAQIKKEAKSISQKYIKVDLTTPFAVMYLPSEGLYAEIAKDSALTTLIQNEYNVTVCGPTTITALLNSLQVGFTTLRIQKQSSEIAKTLQQFQKHFNTYAKLVTKVKGQAETVVKNISEMERQNENINKRLANVGGAIEQAEEELMIASDVDDIGE